jgi:hypothetical protein
MDAADEKYLSIAERIHKKCYASIPGLSQHVKSFIKGIDLLRFPVSYKKLIPLNPKILLQKLLQFQSGFSKYSTQPDEIASLTDGFIELLKGVEKEIQEDRDDGDLKSMRDFQALNKLNALVNEHGFGRELGFVKIFKSLKLPEKISKFTSALNHGNFCYTEQFAEFDIKDLIEKIGKFKNEVSGYSIGIVNETIDDAILSLQNVLEDENYRSIIKKMNKMSLE